MNLNLGCGNVYMKGWINIDNRSNVKKDVMHNLEVFPYPFKDNSFEIVYLSHVLEHLSEPIKVLQEVVRISKNKATIIIKVPHANSYANIASIQHKVNFTEHSFTENHLKEYDLENLKLIKFEFLYPTNNWKRYIPFKRYLKIFFNGLYDDLFFGLEVNK